MMNLHFQMDPDLVSVVSGGGSGHEPFAAGFVGSGCLSGAVAGLVFASPPTEAVVNLIKRVKSKGVKA
jgi:dihydroxyacetone kinase